MTTSARVQQVLRFTDREIQRFDQALGSSLAVVLPDDATADALLRLYRVEDEDREEALAARPDRQTHPELWWVLESTAKELKTYMDRPLAATGFRPWPALKHPQNSVARYLYLWTYLAISADLLAVYMHRAIPAEVQHDTLELGAVMRFHRQVTGLGGLSLFEAWSPPTRFRAADFHLGAHSFTRCKIALGGASHGVGLAVHIPHGQILSRETSRAALATAKRFMRTHYPDERISLFTCGSWLMDPQWSRYLRPDSNIVRFQEDFTLIDESFDSDDDSGDRDVLQTALDIWAPDGPIGSDVLEQIPDKTTLQRAVKEHLSRGEHFHQRTGYRSYDREPVSEPE